MNTPNDGGQAFPIADQINRNGDIQPGAPGMSLRDYFAGQALIGVTSNSELMSIVRKLVKAAKPDDSGIAEFCYQLADEMLDRRSLPFASIPEHDKT